MKQYTIKHKHCHCIAHIEGVDLYDAYRKAGYDPRIWLAA